MFQKKKLEPTIRHGRFYNNDHEGTNRFFFDYVYMAYSFFHEVYIFLKSLYQGRNRLRSNYSNWRQPATILAQAIEPTITWIGHATFLIQIGGVNILTDPIFGDSTIFFPRILPPGIALHDLPKIDFVIISHNHPDHMHAGDLMALKARNPDMHVLAPQGDKKWFTKRNFKNVFEFNWWHTFDSGKPSLSMTGGDNIKFTFLPAYHWSQRGVFDQNRSLWGSWILEHAQHAIYFGGDTGYSSHFKEIAQYFNKIDYALMPVGPCEPREKMCHSHISSEEAGQAFLELNAQTFVPMHWGTYHFGTDTFELPITRLRVWWQQNQLVLENKNLQVLKFGQSISKIAETKKPAETFIQPVVQESQQQINL